MNSKPKIVITGGLGFIFSYVTEYYVRKGWNTVVIDNQSAGSHPEIIDGSFTYHCVDVSDPKVTELIMKEKPDYIIHAAAISDVDYSIREPYETQKQNILMNLHVFNAALLIPNLVKMLYVATDEVYGECNHPMKETDALAPRNPYSASKAAGSLMRIAYDNTYPELKGKLVEMRSCNIFGPRQDDRKVLPTLKHALVTGVSIPLYNDGRGFREFLYVKNIPTVVDLILEKGEGVYNISLNDGRTVKDLIALVEKISGKKIVTHPYNRPGMDMKYEIDAGRIAALGWKPTYTFEEGLVEYLSVE